MQEENNTFKIPIVLFIFKRKETVLKIIERIRNVLPEKIYIISDEGRNDEEKKIVKECRKEIEKAINWNCTIIKNYATENRGVFEQIGLGAKWVFSKEEKAIFLEDDNLPEVSFFYYCEKVLKKYEKDKQIFWVCGTNYLEKCYPKNEASVFISQNLMPCGWASWGKKFNKYYDYELKLTENKDWKEKLKTKYKNKSLYNQQRRSIENEILHKIKNEKYNSWDFHLILSLKMNDLYGIVPKYNQIKNIGVDEFSIHGGNSLELEMTKRFCGIESFRLEEELKLPDFENLDMSFDKKISEIILYPLKSRVILWLREKLNVPKGIRLRHWLLGKKSYEVK